MHGPKGGVCRTAQPWRGLVIRVSPVTTARPAQSPRASAHHPHTLCRLPCAGGVSETPNCGMPARAVCRAQRLPARAPPPPGRQPRQRRPTARGYKRSRGRTALVARPLRHTAPYPRSPHPRLVPPPPPGSRRRRRRGRRRPWTAPPRTRARPPPAPRHQCVCVCVCARARARVRACVCLCVRCCSCCCCSWWCLPKRRRLGYAPVSRSRLLINGPEKRHHPQISPSSPVSLSESLSPSSPNNHRQPRDPTASPLPTVSPRRLRKPLGPSGRLMVSTLPQPLYHRCYRP